MSLGMVRLATWTATWFSFAALLLGLVMIPIILNDVNMTWRDLDEQMDTFRAKKGKIGRAGDHGLNATKIVEKPGVKGLSGSRGRPGLAGKSGIDAPVGKSGQKGSKGRLGFKGTAGIEGAVGQPGKRGPPGPDTQYCRCPLLNGGYRKSFDNNRGTDVERDHDSDTYIYDDSDTYRDDEDGVKDNDTYKEEEYSVSDDIVEYVETINDHENYENIDDSATNGYEYEEFTKSALDRQEYRENGRTTR